MTTKKTLAEHLLAYEVALNDGADVFAGDALKSGKGLNKANKGRANLAKNNDETPLIVVDSTVWGSVSEGFYITENHIHCKEIFAELESFPIETINSIYVDDKNKSIFINGRSFKWLSDVMTPKMKIISSCIQDYIDSCVNTKDAIQEGRGAYLKKLCHRLTIDQTSVLTWSMDVTNKVADAMIAVSNHMPFGGENFLQRTAITLARSTALRSYDELKKEAENKILSLNNSAALRHANEQCHEFDLEETTLSFDFGNGPDRNTSIKNEDWHFNTEDAFSRLRDCGSEVVEQIELLLSRLRQIQEEECEED